jgi:NOL1/NOP2/fmu family ribosome biogenesis protein
MGITNALVTNEHPARLAEKYPTYFDRVLIDAPCSGEGMFRKEEAAITDWSEETVAMCAARQQEILHSGAALVKPGGRLVYSTCTFAPEENELCIEKFLSSHPEFTPEKVDAPWFTPAGTGAFRLWPHKLLGEGHFVAVLRKADGDTREIPQEKGAQMPKVFTEFAKQLQLSLPWGKAVLFGQSLYLAPEEMPDIRGVKVLRPGLELGEVKKDRFEPAHALALALKTAANTVSLPAESPALQGYLQGQTIEDPTRGWTLIQADSYSIGWGKGDGKMLKNHYPKGLRR